MSAARTNLTKRACDGCKIRKVKCDGSRPCHSCTRTGIACTYIKVLQTRGRHRLRDTTRQTIERTQREQGSYHAAAGVNTTYPTSMSDQNNSPSPSTDRTQTPHQSRVSTRTLALQLYIYHVRMFPVWPIVRVEDLIAALQRDKEGTDLEAYALATAVAAATIAQLRLGEDASSSTSECPITADALEAECQRARASFNYKRRVNLNNVRTSFFLHVYHENQQAGGGESSLYLREAISMAQMMNLHREASYAGLPADEQQLRRRVLWLLFVTERGVCVLHKLPVILKTNISAPAIDTDDESHVLPAFLNLVNLFWTFDQSGMFDIVQDHDNNNNNNAFSSGVPVDGQFMETLQRKLQEAPVELDNIRDVQKADICVTRHWMRMILWRLYAKRSRLSPSPPPSSPGQVMSMSFPVTVALEFLNTISQLPRAAIEAHGFGMELKILEIANSVAEAISNLTLLPQPPVWGQEDRPSSILTRLHLILSSFRGRGDKGLVDLLYKKMVEVQTRVGPALPQSPSGFHVGQSDRHPQDDRHDHGQGANASASARAEHTYTHGMTVSTSSLPFGLDGVVATDMDIVSEYVPEYNNNILGRPRPPYQFPEPRIQEQDEVAQPLQTQNLQSLQNDRNPSVSSTSTSPEDTSSSGQLIPTTYTLDESTMCLFYQTGDGGGGGGDSDHHPGPSFSQRMMQMVTTTENLLQPANHQPQPQPQNGIVLQFGDLYPEGDNDNDGVNVNDNTFRCGSGSGESGDEDDDNFILDGKSRELCM